MSPNSLSETTKEIKVTDIPCKFVFFTCDSWNYTFHSLGSMGTILLLNLCSSYTYDKSSTLWSYSVYVSSLVGIMYISSQYFDNYVTNFKRVSCQDKRSFGI